MPFIFRLLKAASLTAATNNDFYKVGTTANPAATSAIISNIRLFNTDTVARSVDLYTRLVSGGTQVHLLGQVSINAASSFVFNTMELTLAKDSVIDVSTTAPTPSRINCFINGVERV
jgi:hypothetical protein